MHFKYYAHFIPVAVMVAANSFAGELKVDINRDTKNNDNYTETGYVKWSEGSYDGATSADGTSVITRSFTTEDGEYVTIGFAQTAASAAAGGEGIENLYNSSLVAGTAKLLGDGLAVKPRTFTGGGQLQMTITGLAAGEHSLLTFHNGADGGWDDGRTLSPIDVSVNGTLQISDLTQTINASVNSSSASSYVTFSVGSSNEVVTILFAASASTSYTICNPMVNGFEIDRPNIYRSATQPNPANEDGHVDADDGTVLLSWAGALADDIVSHDLYFGTNYTAVKSADHSSALFVGNQTATNCEVVVDDPHATYYWRVDEVNAAGEATTGSVWLFRPRHLAFPGAEGYGRFARGGRGGAVVHVTSLADYTSGETPIPGTLRYAVEEESGPRVVIFDVSGLITLTGKLTMSDDFVTIAGQTAPGKGICIRKYPFGLSGADDCVVRFIRNRPGDISGTTIDGGGLAGCDYSIIDHCSISWSIDEAFSGRSAKNITLQRTLISEALNIAGHQNYPAGTRHGYAATISGDVGSYHHNLLAHCEGRNWSMGGGLDADGNWAGKLDLRNNVVYNWGGRTTDGGAHEVNFVGNYYKPGAASDIFTVLNPTYDNFPGTQQYYMVGNVMPGYFDADDQDAGRTVAGSNGGSVPTDYDVWVDAPFFESYVETQSADAAYKRVLSDVGCNQPLDEHDERVIQETLAGTYTYTGLGDYGGDPGLPNSQSDVGGWDDYPVVERPADWDSDGDGLPDWWEEITESDPCSAEGDLADAHADADGDGYTNLDDYLNWLAQPHFDTTPGSPIEIDLAAFSAGYESAGFTVSDAVGGAGELLEDGHTVRFTPSEGFIGLGSFSFSAEDGDGDSMEGTIGLRISEDATDSQLKIMADVNPSYVFYGRKGYDYTLQYSTDLSDWTGMEAISANGSWYTNSIPSALQSLPAVFLRARR